MGAGLPANGAHAGTCSLASPLPQKPLPPGQSASAGRAFDAALLQDLPADVDPCGENGEFHTCVCAGPMFAAPLSLQRGQTVLRDGRFLYTDFLPG